MIWRWLIFVAFLPTATRSLPNGAPREACNAMLPRHHVFVPQMVPSPFQIRVQPNIIFPGQQVTVLLQAPMGRFFMGYLVTARTMDAYMALIGSFSGSYENYLDCGAGPFSAVTHASNTRKNSVTFQWTAPIDFQGTVTFRATFVENFATFWANVQSPPVVVTSNPVNMADPYNLYNVEPNIININPQQQQLDTLESAENHPSHQVNDLKAVYDDCEVTKGCFGEPPGCVNSKNCKMMVTFHPHNEHIYFELVGPADGWIGLGLSKDQQMGDDSVVECVQNSKGRVEVLSSYNYPEYRNERLPLPAGLSNMTGRLVDGHIFCSFYRQGNLQIHGTRFNLLTDPHYLLLAKGLTENENSIRKHNMSPYRSASAVNLTAVSSIRSSSDSLMYAHGCLMVMAWVGTVSIAVFLARFYKYTWTEEAHCGQKIWFTWHRFLNVATILLSSIAFIIIFAYVGGWSQIWTINAHPVLGVVAFVLMWIQPVMAFLRPHPGTPYRPIFNWAHFLVGNSSRIIAFATLFLAVEIQKVNLSNSFTGVLGAFVAFEIISYLVMEGYSYFRSKDSREQIPMKDLPQTNDQPHPPKSQDAPGSGFRKMFLVFYVIGVVGFTLALVIIVGLSSNSTTS